MVNGWNSKKLTSVCKVNIGLTHTPKYVENGIPFLSVKDIKNGKIIFDDIKYISSEEFNTISNASKPQVGDILICRVGTLGNPCVVNLATPFAIFVSLGYLRTYGEVDALYLHQWLNSNIFMNQVNKKIAGSSQKNLNTGWLKEFDIEYPSDLIEQQAISTTLADVDELIANLEKLIEKKKSIKQGTMQELLTGNKRLQGFNGEWVKVNMSKNSKIKARIGWQGLTTAEYLDDGYSLLVTGTDFENGRINWAGCHYVTKERFDQDTNIQIKNDDILITKDGTIGKVAKVAGLHRPATLNSGVFVIRPTTSAFTPNFLFHILMSNIFKKFIQELTAGSTIIHLYQKDIVKFEFFAPPTIEEQNAISEIIENMDCEIDQLNRKLQKYRLVKQGMMQKLLTGEIRLV